MPQREMWQGMFGGDAELGQATCKPNSRPQHPLVTSYLLQHQKRRCPHGWALSHSSESFIWVGEHIWQPLSVSQCFFYNTVCQVISNWHYGYLRLGLGWGSQCSNKEIWYKDQKGWKGHVENITIFLVMILLPGKLGGCMSRFGSLRQPWHPTIISRVQGGGFVFMCLCFCVCVGGRGVWLSEG